MSIQQQLEKTLKKLEGRWKGDKSGLLPDRGIMSHGYRAMERYRPEYHPDEQPYHTDFNQGIVDLFGMPVFEFLISQYPGITGDTYLARLPRRMPMINIATKQPNMQVASHAAPFSPPSTSFNYGSTTVEMRNINFTEDDTKLDALLGYCSYNDTLYWW